MSDSGEIEVDAAQILRDKKIKLRTVGGTMLFFYLDVFESESPYVMIFIVKTAQRHSIRMDIQKDDLARELRLWLEGKIIRDAAVVASTRIDGIMQQFIKFGKTPKQEDLIMWILSRSELSWSNNPQVVFGGTERTERNEFNGFRDEYPKTAEAASRNRASQEGSGTFASTQFNDIFTSTMRSAENPPYTSSSSKILGSSEKRHTRSVENFNDEDLGTFELTRKLLGKSASLAELSKSKVKGRAGAKQTVNLSTWGPDHYTLGASIEQARKNIEAAMEERRRSLEVAKVRRDQAAGKYLKIREELAVKKQGGGWLAAASQELETLYEIHDDIQDDIKRQKNRTARSVMKVGWTMAPNGNQDRRGHYMPGPTLGPGPLPANATSRLRDPRVTSVVKYHYWDKSGRRHDRPQEDGEIGENGGGSLVEQAMEVIRRTAAIASAYKLDFKKVFEEFDTSGDGFLSPEEMADAFLRMGVKLDVETMAAIFKHFDPNDSGSIHYGEFVWAFFNRRTMVRQWKRHTDGFTDEQLRSRFYQFDINGDGRLNHKEFKNLLVSFGIKISDADQDTLINRFDVDHDGDIDMHEFFAFIEGEKESLHLDPQHESEQLKRVIAHTNSTNNTNTNSSTSLRDSSPSRKNPHNTQGRTLPPAHRPDWDSSPPKRRPLNDKEEDDASMGRGRGRSEGGGGKAHGRNNGRSMSGSRGSRQSSSPPRPPRHGGSQRIEGREGGREERRDDRHEGREDRVGRSRGREELGPRGSRTSPAAMQNTHNNYNNNSRDLDPPSYHEEEEGPAPYYSGNNEEKDFAFQDEDISNEEAIWATKMLRAQTHVESRLGKSYY